MKPPSKTLIAFALGLAASAATADMTAESSGGLDPLLVNTATNAGGNSPSMTCPTSIPIKARLTCARLKPSSHVSEAHFLFGLREPGATGRTCDARRGVRGPS